MAKPPKLDLEKAPEFEKVVQTFLKTPPRQHKEDVGKGKRREAERLSRLRKSGAQKLMSQRESDA